MANDDRDELEITPTEVARAIGDADDDTRREILTALGLTKSRRRMLQAAGVLGAGAAVGGTAAQIGVGGAQADSQGHVGTQSDRVNNIWASTVNAESLVIGGTLFEEDDNSPINASSTSSTTFNPSGNWNHVIVIPDTTESGWNQLRVNDDSGSNYDETDNNDDESTGNTEWSPGYWTALTMIELMNNGSRIRMRVCPANSGPGIVVYGDNDNISGNITKLEFIDSGGSNRTGKARVYGRTMNI